MTVGERRGGGREKDERRENGERERGTGGSWGRVPRRVGKYSKS